ncbi:alkaline phosphatase family protein [Nocardioides sp. CN2-186]|uniref:alkaline phosphatase family protein n=1 Tax=Nocardioides tweenelious TaxID=3156607 RepID=UPI0032B3AC6B
MSTSRRTFLQAGAAGLFFSTAVGAPALAAGSKRKRAYVIVIDGCRPDELDSGLTPHLAALRDSGLRFPRAESMPVMETIPNHVMMMTGLRPDRTGVPANSVYDRTEKTVRDLDRATDIRSDTLIERLNRRGFTTGTVLSKEYLYGVFGERATHRWEPMPTLPITEHAPDVFTIEAALTMLEELDPSLMFINLGDIDRFGHADLTGPLGLKVARRTALADTDTQVQRFVDALKDQGKWEHAMVVVLADHSMDWSTSDKVISLQGVLDADPLLAGNVQIADNGGADLLYWTGPAAQKEDAVARMRQVARAQDGVLAAYDRRADWLRLGPEAGEVVVFCQAGWRFSDPDPAMSNPIPGNHGHPATRAIPFFVAGGHPGVPHRTASTRVAHTVDVAPTLAAFFGVGHPRGGYDGRNLV